MELGRYSRVVPVSAMLVMGDACHSPDPTAYPGEVHVQYPGLVLTAV